MEWIFVGVLVIVCFILVAKYGSTKKEIKKIEENKENEIKNLEVIEEKDEEEFINTQESNNKFPYVLSDSVMSNKELKFFNALEPIARESNLKIIAKMRLADIVKVPKNTYDYIRWFNYIKAKHVDFILCDSEMKVKLVIEVDDYTHQYDNRKKRDEFVDKIFIQLDIPILHIYKWTDEELKQQIEEKLGIKKESTAEVP